MANKKQIDVASLQPDELNALKTVVREFIERLSNIDNEAEELKESRKDLIAEFEDKLDVKTLKAAMRVAKIQGDVAHRHTFDLFMEVLSDDYVNRIVD